MSYDSAGNLFSEIANLDKEIFDVLLDNDKIKIERIISKGHKSPETGWYDQDENEWVIVVKGEAIISFENNEVNLKSGGYLNIPAHTKHKVSWTDPKCETIWLVIYY